MAHLINERPVAQRKARICIQNRQLRDLVHATERAGEIITVHNNAIVKYSMTKPHEPPSTLSRLPFNATTLSYSYDPRPGAPSLVAVGGPKAKVMILSLPPPSISSPSGFPGKPTLEDYTNPLSYYYDPMIAMTAKRRNNGTGSSFRPVVSTLVPQPGHSIINSVAFAPLPTDTSALASAQSGERRLLVSSNDDTVRIYRTANNRSSPGSVFDGHIRVKEEAFARYNTRMNHSSVSPDGTILLSAGDSPFLHLHSLSSLPPAVFSSSYTNSTNPRPPRPSIYDTSRHPKPIHVIPTSTLIGSKSRWCYSPGDEHNTAEAIFSTAFSGDGWKLAAGSQDGIVQVWDIRSLKQRLAIFGTSVPISSIHSLLDEIEGNVDPHHECPCQGKVWGVRSLRFSPSSTMGRWHSYSDNRELLVFSEHQSTIHIVDARTFDASPESRQSLFLPSILQRYPRTLYSEQLTKPVEEVIAKRGKKRKRNELSDTDGDEAERKRHEPADGTTNPMVPVQGTGPIVHLPRVENIPEQLRTSMVSGEAIQPEHGLGQPGNNPERGTNGHPSIVLGRLSPGNAEADTETDGSVALRQALFSESSVAWDQVPVEGVDQWPVTAPGLYNPPAPQENTGDADDTVIREAQEIMESSGQLARRLRRVNTRLQFLLNTSAGTSRASTTRSTSRIRPRSLNAQDLSSAHSPRGLEALHSFISRQDLRRYSASPFGRTAITPGDQGMHIHHHRILQTRDRVEALRRERDLMASLETDSDEDVDLDLTAPRGATVDPSFSSDLVRQMMVRWRDEEGDEMTMEADARDASQSREPVDPEDELLWATMGLDAADAAEEIERWALRADEMPMETENIDADTMTNGIGSGDETVDVDEELDLINRIQDHFVGARSSIRSRLASNTLVPASPPRMARSTTPSLRDFLRQPLYQHSNRSTNNLPMTSSFASPAPLRAVPPSTLALPPTDRPRFTASPEPIGSSFTGWNSFRREYETSTPPVLRGLADDPRSPPSRTFPAQHPRFRFSPARPFGQPLSSVRVRPFSSRAFGSSPLYSSFHDEHDHGESDDELEDDGAWNEKKALDIAGFTFGIPGTESEGTFVVGTLGGRGRAGGRLLEFSTRRKQDGEVVDAKTAGPEDVRWTRWTGKKYAQGELV